MNDRINYIEKRIKQLEEDIEVVTKALKDFEENILSSLEKDRKTLKEILNEVIKLSIITKRLTEKMEAESSQDSQKDFFL